MCAVPVIRAVNVGRPKDKQWAGLGYTSIDKATVTGPVLAHRRGLVGDVVSDTKHHGGPDQAVYAFAREDLDHWGRELGRTIRDGQFGENLTTEGIDVNEAEVGDHWRIGTALFEVASVRIPCNDFKGWMGESGYDNRRWVKRFTMACRPGPYLRVLEEGHVAAGDEIETVHRQGHGVTVSTMFRAITLDHSLLPSLLQIDGLVEQVRVKATRIAEGLPPGRSDV
ncbi:MOSC domain-containing protein [Nocardioides sp. CER19]|uniref:MOSC domain-containing protein n=1 Tax=Nocardioides sp. CER19 TaxID=3038538 RepID=UPI00244B0D44|nr:MOSC domain-containing protein [Nocardioides sp. CER19]MDH2415485.1 MOSC domain-containing protein [Nocardioides sp. CER19]